jgi:hypothetical protein
MSQFTRPQPPSQQASAMVMEGPILPARPCLPPRPKPIEPKNEQQQISPPSSQPSPMQEPLQPTPIEVYQATSAIYEEIKDDVVSKIDIKIKDFFKKKIFCSLFKLNQKNLHQS